ncbi:MAG: response regulator [Lachnospiraceae bacterium]|nr:response regulator [Lachnospiraceae bacterium]
MDVKGRKERILVIDDQRMLLLITKDMLSPYYRIDCVSSGREAQEYLKFSIPDLILLDLHLPEMDGIEILQWLQSKEEYAKIPVIFLTSDTSQENEVKIFKEGAMDFILKPFVAEVAVQRIDRILKLKKLQSSLQQEVNIKTKELQKSYQKIEHLSRQIMQAMAGAIEAKDHYTNGHSERVAVYSRELSLRLGKSWQESESIYYAALLHDVGKIGIPDNIINKESSLTDEEFDIIRGHTTVGASILENISEMPEISFGARWHHERYDGRGYPDKLAGMEIPEIARIIGVADAYDAMSSNRSYRRALPQKVIFKEITNGRGVQFDPIIADKMLDMIREDVNYQLQECPASLPEDEK